MEEKFRKRCAKARRSLKKRSTHNSHLLSYSAFESLYKCNIRSISSSKRYNRRNTKCQALTRAKGGPNGNDGVCMNGIFFDECLGFTLIEALQAQHHALGGLHSELNAEREASAGAVDDAMLMISRLQDEKSRLSMQNTQYLRETEQRMVQAQRMMCFYEDILDKKNEEIRVLQHEVQSYRNKCSESGSNGNGSSQEFSFIEGPSSETQFLNGIDYSYDNAGYSEEFHYEYAIETSLSNSFDAKRLPMFHHNTSTSVESLDPSFTDLRSQNSIIEDNWESEKCDETNLLNQKIKQLKLGEDQEVNQKGKLDDQVGNSAVSTEEKYDEFNKTWMDRTCIDDNSSTESVCGGIFKDSASSRSVHKRGHAFKHAKRASNSSTELNAKAGTSELQEGFLDKLQLESDYSIEELEDFHTGEDIISENRWLIPSSLDRNKWYMDELQEALSMYTASLREGTVDQQDMLFAKLYKLALAAIRREQAANYVQFSNSKSIQYDKKDPTQLLIQGESSMANNRLLPVLMDSKFEELGSRMLALENTNKSMKRTIKSLKHKQHLDMQSSLEQSSDNILWRMVAASAKCLVSNVVVSAWSIFSLLIISKYKSSSKKS